MTNHISNQQRWAILAAIDRALPAAHRPTELPIAVLYPQSVPEIDRHIDDLVQFVRGDRLSCESPAARIRKGICNRCPHQYPQRYCPLRQTGGCVPFINAEQIARTITGVLADGK